MVLTSVVIALIGIFVALILIVTCLAVPKSQSVPVEEGGANVDGKAHNAFVWRYLLCYLVSTAADWMQGAYVYALYESFGFTKDENAILFVAGFGASAIFGIFAGLIADRMGRRTACILYCALYMASCMTKHFKVYEVLMLGRILGGCATSLLFSAFDSWLVAEHEKRNFDSTKLNRAFSHAVYFNSVVAVACGLLGQFGSSWYPQTQISPVLKLYAGEYLIPFDIAFCFCALAAVLLWTTWTENFGIDTGGASATSSVLSALNLVVSNPSILAIGVVSSLFEASMYIFIFNWTPMLTTKGADKPPYGLIFALFMLSCMLGSKLSDFFCQRMTVHRLAAANLLLATVAIATLLLDWGVHVNLLAFLMFEISVGMYFPTVGTVKAEVVPEANRATIYNIFRIPLNAIVVCALCFRFSIITSFMISTICLSICVVCMTSLSFNLDRLSGITMASKSAYDTEHAAILGKSEK